MIHRTLGVLGLLPVTVGVGVVACCRDRCGCHDNPASGGSEPFYVAPVAAADGVTGTFNRTDLLVAYYRSAQFNDRLAGLATQREAALARGDKTRAAQLERQGQSMQDTAHRQLGGRESLTNVAEALRDELPRIAQEAGVSRIVERGTEPPGAKTVDVTARLTARLPAAR